MFNLFNVLSFDPKRIKLEISHCGKIIVTKKTTAMEYENIILAQRHIVKHCPSLVLDKYGDISVFVAKVFNWNIENGILSTFFCKGENIETILRVSIGTNRKSLVQLIRKMFEMFKLHGFMCKVVWFVKTVNLAV